MHSRNILIIPLLVSAAVAYCDFESQTDWSGGPGEYGPVLTWQDCFWESDSVNWSSCPGSLVPVLSSVEFSIEENFYEAMFVHAEDLDADGDLDVLCAAWTADQLVWWENVDGSGLLWVKHIIATNYIHTSCLFTADLDDDGDVDVLASADSGNEMAWWENIDGTGMSWQKHSIDPSYGGGHYVYAADIDDDGDPDVLGAAYSDEEITWWENTDGSATSWNKFTIASSYGEASAVFADDINGDGFVDVLGAARSDDEITWWENSAATPGQNWIRHVIGSSFDGAIHVYTDDIDGDGHRDVLGAALNGGVSWWENLDGSGTAWFEHVVGSAGGYHSVVTSDLDGDGDLDLATAVWGSNKFSWWENTDGSGMSWDEHVLNDGLYHARCVHCADLDSDGFDEIIGSAPGAGAVRYWKVTYASQGCLESSILDAGGYPLWDYLEWDAYTPPGTSVLFQVRASEDYADMGAWSDTLTQPCLLGGILDDGDRYCQYKAILQSGEPVPAPVLNSVMVSWDVNGTGDEPQVTEYRLIGVTPNPTPGNVCIRYAIPVMSEVRFEVFDLTGRAVSLDMLHEVDSGLQEEILGDFHSGVYFCRMTSGEFTDTQKFVVIE